ncbi:molecular chaperone DnaK, partial [Vibrio breoganii]
TKQEVHQIALEGFFPLSEFTETPDKRRSAVVEFGLPYVADPAVSKHVAEFLATHQQVSKAALENSDSIEFDDTKPAIPVGVLLNGGVFNSELVTERITQLLGNWNGSPITVLDNPHPD